jgi:hypothetical protein
MKSINEFVPYVDYVAFYKEPTELVEANFAGKRGDKFILTFIYRHQLLVNEVPSEKIYAIKNKEGKGTILGLEGMYDIVKN